MGVGVFSTVRQSCSEELMKRFFTDQDTAGITPVQTEQTQTIACVGSALRFSDRYLTILDSLIAESRFLRFPDLDHIAVQDQALGHLALVLLDENYADELRQNADKVFQKCGNCMVALAYTNPQVAQSVLAMREADQSLSRLSYFPLSSQFEVSLSILRLMLCGEQFIPAGLQSMSSTTIPPGALPKEGAEQALTRREWEVLALVAEGKQNKIIAHTLKLSEHTVKLHLHHVLSKLSVSNRTEASAWYHAHGPRQIS